MYLPTIADESVTPTPRDPLAVAVGNASLLGVGYLLLGRRALGVLSALVSLALLGVVGGVVHAGWVQWVLLAWWAAPIVHGWVAARRGATSTMAGQRVGVAVLAVAVLGTLLVVRLDLNGRADDATAAHERGDCDRTLSIADGVGFWQRIGDGPVADDLLDSAEACRLVQRARGLARTDRLAAADTMASYALLPAARWSGARRYHEDLLLDQVRDDLRTGLANADRPALERGFDVLATVRTDFPNRQQDTDAALEAFLTGLPTDDACRTVGVTDWITQQKTESDDLDSARTVAAKVAPLALLTCADTRLAAGEAANARTTYQQFLDTYPHDPGAPRATRGVTLATWAIQLAEVRGLVTTSYADETPAYCDNPKPYGAARPYRGRGTFRAMIFGQDTQRKALPGNWRASDPKNATLIICAGEVEHGDVAQTCTYYKNSGYGAPVAVSFHKRETPVRVYEVRTGRKLADFGLQIGGAACRPEFLNYRTPAGVDVGPGPQYVQSSDEDIRAAYRTMLVR